MLRPMLVMKKSTTLNHLALVMWNCPMNSVSRPA